MATTVKSISEKMGINPSLEKIINKYRAVDLNRPMSDKELLVRSIILNLIKSSNNGGYQFTADTIRRRFFDVESKNLTPSLLAFYKQADEKELSSEDCPELNKNKISSIGGKNFINDDIVIKICGHITLTTDFKILPLAQQSGKYVYRLVKENNFFYEKKVKEIEIEEEESDVKKILNVAEQANLGKEELKTLLAKMAEKFNQIEGEKVHLQFGLKVK